MKYLVAIIRPHKLEEVKQALEASGECGGKAIGWPVRYIEHMIEYKEDW